MPLGRIVFDDIRPRTPTGHPPKAAVGEHVTVAADIFRDGHDHVAARVAWRPAEEADWRLAVMQEVGNDRFEATFVPDTVGPHELRIEAWTDRFGTWRHHTEARAAAEEPDLEVELLAGAELLEVLAASAPAESRPRLLDAVATLRSPTCSLRTKLDTGLDDHLVTLLEGVPDPYDLTGSEPRALWVDRERGRTSSWYELFPRSEGGLKGAAERLDDVAAMGFDVVYLPPVHPIGRTHRKGTNNTLTPGPDDPGSPWAIGAAEGGHTALHPDLGTFADFDAFVTRAEELGMEVALDYALQCSPDHPWVAEHPEWFHHRPDGSIRYAENPPKKYQDIYPINFWPEREEDRVALWEACRDVVDFWIGHGVRIFRVDNPHTKPFPFWEWMIGSVRAAHPDVLFLAEAFTRPKVMATLAALGFTQSYTYFTWRTARWELRQYLDELAHGPLADYFRPNFWPNTPDILSGPLRNGSPRAFRLRAVLAALLSPSWGMYSGYELCENQPASDHNEEYLHSEKYELRERDWDAPHSLTPFITRLNAVRREHPAFAELRTLRFHGSTDDENFLVWSKTAPDGTDPVLVIANLDPDVTHEGLLHLDLGALGLPWSGPYEARDELTGETFVWEGPNPYVKLGPGAGREAHVIALEAPG